MSCLSRQNCSQFLNSKMYAKICDEMKYNVSEVLSGFNFGVVDRFENKFCVALDCFKCL